MGRSRPRRLVIIATGGAILLLALPVFPAAARAPSPRALYKALLASLVSQSQLPAGFHSPKTKSKAPGRIPKRHYAVGEVEIDLNEGEAGIVYVVFPTHGDVLGNFSDAVQTYETRKTITRQRCAPDLPNPCVTLSGSVSRIGFTTIAFSAGNVGVTAYSTRRGPTSKSGNARATLRLARFALRHLRAIQRRLN